MEHQNTTRVGFLLSSALGLLLLLTLAGRAAAQSKLTHYTDVSAGAWYEEAASALLDMDALNSDEERLRPNDTATRAEMAKLLVEMNDRPLVYPSRASFDDISETAWYFPYMEAAARAGWYKGDRNCYGTHPCTVRPRDGLNRAEAAILLVRAFALTRTDAAPDFMDNNRPSLWYYQPIQIAADHCVLEGDGDTGLVRPASLMNRAEMIVMFHRASQNLEYGRDCGVRTPFPRPDLESAAATSSRRVRLTFTTDLDLSVANDDARYAVTLIGGSDLNVTNAIIIDDNIVDVTLATDLEDNESYRVTVTNMKTDVSVTFSASETFTFTERAAAISDAVATSATRLRIAFTTDVTAGRADDTFRYTIRESANQNVRVSVEDVTVIDDKTVDLRLSTALRSNVSYVLTATDILTTRGVEFTDTETFTFAEPTAEMTSIVPISSAVIRLTFSADLDPDTAELSTHYRVDGNATNITVSTARLITDRTVELTLGQNMETQTTYTVAVTNMRTAGGVVFSDVGSTLYVGSNVQFHAALTGLREVPPVVTTMSGSGSFILHVSGLDYTVGLSNMTGAVITGAHFHRGELGSNGPILHGITFVGNRATGTWTGLTEQDRNDLLNGNIYVNVHTQANPNGEIRGQVIR